MPLRSKPTASCKVQLVDWIIPPSIWFASPSGLMFWPVSAAAARHTRTRPTRPVFAVDFHIGDDRHLGQVFILAKATPRPHAPSPFSPAFQPAFLVTVSIADMASWPWVAKPLGQPLEEFPNVARWPETIKQRPAVQRGSIWARICAGRPRHPTTNGGSYSTRERGTCRSVRGRLSIKLGYGPTVITPYRPFA
jgi:hypothetical protein